MARPARLSRALILDAAEAVVAEDGSLHMTRLGERLGADPSAVYRHFANKDEIVRAIGDRLLSGLVDDLPIGDGWRCEVAELCRRLRSAHLRHPDLPALVRDRPPLQPNETELTDRLLGLLAGAGFDRHDVAMAYHTLIEFTLGSALLDGSMAALPADEREAEYRAWRAHYAALPGDEYPHATAHASALYQGSPDDRFEPALECLLDGLEQRLRSRSATSQT